jgi:VWFA-related protein
MASMKRILAASAAALLTVQGLMVFPSPGYAQGPQGPQSPAPAQEPQQPQPPSNQPGQKPQQPPPPQVSIAIQSNLVNVDAIVTDQDGNLVTGLKKQNFRILDDGQPQEITNFAPTDAPITTVMLVEFSARFYNYFGFKSAYWADGFLQSLKPQDWVALKTFDLKPTLQVDFTQNKREVDDAIVHLGFPGFSEMCLFDALYQTLNELKDVKGKRSVLVLATGYDTLSKHTLDQTLARLKENDITIFCVGMGEEIDLGSANGGGVGYLQAKNQLTTFAKMSGGYAYFPRFTGEMSGIFNTIAQYLRSQYTLVFAPNTAQDGKYHKLTVQVLDDQGNPLQLANAKGKMKKAVVTAREGYLAPTPQPGN